MATDQDVNLDAFIKTKYKDLPPIQTSFQDKDKPLPAIKEPSARNSKESLRNTSNPRRNSKESVRNTAHPKRTSDRTYRRLNPRSALFHLFSRPKVEKQRGFNEPGLVSPPPVTEPDRSTPSPELIIQAPSPSTAGPESIYRRPSTSLSFREDPRKLMRSRTPTSEEVPTQPTLPTQEETPDLPSLFDVYTDSKKVTIAQIIDESSAIRLPRTRKANASHIVPAIINEERRGSVDSGKGEKVHNKSGRNSLSYAPFQRKIFALSGDGLVLQFAEKGGGERLPERTLQLGHESAAFACDLIPGRPYVLQIDQNHTTTELQHVPSQSILTKMGLKGNLPRVGEHSMLLILDTAEELTSWMNAVRKQIQSQAENVSDADKATLSRTSSTPPKIRARQRGSISQESAPKEILKFSATEALVRSLHSEARRGSNATVAVPHKAHPEPIDRSVYSEARRGSNATVSLPQKAYPEPIDRSLYSEARRGSNATVSLPQKAYPEPTDARPRRDSNAAIPRSQPEQDGKDVLKKMASFDTTGSRDSPLSIGTHDSAVSFGAEQARKRIVRDRNASQKSSIGSLNDEFVSDSPILPKAVMNSERPRPNLVVDRPRPDSFVAGIPLLWPARKPDHPVLSASKNPTKPTLNSPMKPTSNNPMKPTSNNPTKPTSNTPGNSPVARLPLKINPPTGGPTVSRQRPTQSPVKPLMSAYKPSEMPIRRPQRTPSAKLSLFPSSVPSPPSSAPVTAKPLPPSPMTPMTPGDDMGHSQNRPLRRPASIQVRANYAPFLSSYRNMNSHRPQLSKAESTPSLRSAATFPRVAETKKPSSSPLPPLDLGMPIVGLAPPAPPPSLPLPRLPSAPPPTIPLPKLPHQKTLAV